MSAPSAPPASSAGRLWFVLAVGAVIVTALIAGSRAKPPLLFAAGYGFVLGMVLRLAAEALNLRRTWPVIVLAALLVGGGFVLSFVPSYQRNETAWESQRALQPTDPMAIALLNQLPDTEKETPRYSLSRFLSQRAPGWASTWPHALFMVEWITAMLLAAGTMIVGRGNMREPEALARNGAELPR